MRINNQYVNNLSKQTHNNPIIPKNRKNASNIEKKSNSKNVTIKKSDVLKEFINKMQITYKKRGFYRSSISSRQAITSYKTALSYQSDFSISKKIADLQVPFDEIV